MAEETDHGRITRLDITGELDIYSDAQEILITLDEGCICSWNAFAQMLSDTFGVSCDLVLASTSGDYDYAVALWCQAGGMTPYWIEQERRRWMMEVVGDTGEAKDVIHGIHIRAHK